LTLLIQFVAQVLVEAKTKKVCFFRAQNQSAPLPKWRFFDGKIFEVRANLVWVMCVHPFYAHEILNLFVGGGLGFGGYVWRGEAAGSFVHEAGVDEGVLERGGDVW
jgi:hypothetical protein